MGNGQSCNRVHLIDFGLAKRYRKNPFTGHINYHEYKRFIGTTRYVSLNTHLGVEQARRDDLEALGYILVQFSTGSLPWMGVVTRSKKRRNKRIGAVKISISLEKLCVGLPPCYQEYLAYVRGLGYHQNPDYGHCRQIFRNYFLSQNMKEDFDYDWYQVNRRRKTNSSLSPSQSSKEFQMITPRPNI
ncbi:unnamed protein product, partial [Mesorhabditis belari]|uniref:Protein kinase domain-containing protein n=1 Tax=Mesorhabditis belari TaxID=2138241 RepID=A0AAF3EPB7_9BILA